MLYDKNTPISETPENQLSLQISIESNQGFVAKLDVNNYPPLTFSNRSNNSIGTSLDLQRIKVKTDDSSSLCLIGLKLTHIVHWELFFVIPILLDKLVQENLLFCVR